MVYTIPMILRAGVVASSSSVSLQSGDKVAVIGCSLDNEKGTGGQFASWMEFNGHRLNVGAYGWQTHGGDTVTDYVDRGAAALAIKPKVVIIGGGENDANKGDTATVTMTSRRALLDILTAPGTTVKLIVLATTILPTGLNVTKQGYVSTDAAAVRALDNTLYNGVLIRVVDYNSIRSGGDSYSDAQGNGIHNSAMGAVKMGWALDSVVRPYMTGAPVLNFGTGETSGNLNTAWNFSGTGGNLSNATGQVADNWTLANASGATIVASKGFMADGITPAQILTISGSASSTSAISLTRTISGLSTAGKFLRQTLLYELTAADGSKPVGVGAFGQGGSLPAAPYYDTGAAATGKPPVPGPRKYGSYIFDTVASANTGRNDLVPSMRGVPAITQTTTASTTQVVNLRCVAGTVDIVLKVARAEWFYAEDTAYAAPFYQGVSRTRPSDSSSYNIFEQPTLTGSGNSRTARLAACSGGGLTWTHQWRNGSGDIPGATSQLYDSGGVSGTYYDRQTISNSFGSITVDSASFTI